MTSNPNVLAGAKALASCAVLCSGLVALPRVARADTPAAGTTPSDPSTAPIPVGGAPAGEPANPPPTDEGSEIVFHAAPRASDMAAFASSSLQQVHIGSTKARYAMNIFGDVNFHFGNPPADNGSTQTSLTTHPSFALGTLSFLITGELEKHFVSTAEFALEYDDATNQVGIDIERLHVGYLGEHFFVYAGRVHTAFGYWNNAYHHGKWLQPNEERPRWVEFEDTGGLLPVHTVGLSAGTNIDVARGSVLKITVAVSNGRGNVVDDIRNTFDYQDGKSVNSQIELVGIGVPELRAGVSGMYDHILGLPATDPNGGPTRPALPDTGIDEYIMGAHVAYPGYPFLLIAEGYWVLHHVPGHIFNTYGGFVTAARAFGTVTPYLRAQWIGTSGGTDPFFVPNPADPFAPRLDELEGVVGLRIDLTDWTAIRAEYRATRMYSDDVRHAGILQWSWGF
jgi:hypothetical protein